MEKVYQNQSKICFIIAGPNGAGKTTFAMHYLPEIVQCYNFINADAIAQGLNPLNYQQKQFAASRIFLKEIQRYLEQKIDFAFEKTLSGLTYTKLIKQMRNNDWQVILFYLWIPSIEFSQARVKTRVEQGGHDIPVKAIQRRYAKSLFNLFNVYRNLVNKTYCYDNSGNLPKLIFEQDYQGIKIVNFELYQLIKK